MSYPIKIASSQQEKEAIYRFRYKVYMEELNKHHIAADHANKMMFNEADDHTILYYADDGKDVIATVRSQRGIEGVFTKDDNEFFGIDEFEKYIDYKKIAIVDRLIVDKAFRHSALAHEMMLATYLGGLEVGTRICFITCDEKLLPMYLRYGFRIYTEPALLSSGEKRNKLVLCLCDRDYLQKVRSPFLLHLPESFDDKEKYATIIEKKLKLRLTKELPIAINI